MTELFPEIPKIKYEGKDSTNPLAFKYYNPEEMIDGKPMKEHLRFAMAYWHTMCAGGADPFGSETMIRPWNNITDPMKKAEARMHGIFELTEKLSIPFFCFHDRDIAPEGKDFSESNSNFWKIVNLAEELMKDSPTKLLWGTANLFNNPRYMAGAGTSPNAEVFAYGAAQVKNAIAASCKLGAQNYVFWGGREGYDTILNTDMKKELDHMAKFFHLAVDYAKEIGFKGQFLIEPKPKEPTKHQYDYDSQSVFGFLKAYDLLPYFKLNIETNHATLAGHSMQHELHYARVNGILGSVDANQGDELLGWDTDQFPTNLYVTTSVMYEVLKNGGLGKGGLNFDAKPRRCSYLPQDIAASHIAGMDGFARGFKAAKAMLDEGILENFIAKRYSSWDNGIGKDILDGKADFNTLEKYAENHEPVLESGCQEWLESVVNKYL